MAITYTKLRSGAWGVRSTEEIKPGQAITVEKRDRTTKMETVEKIVWANDGVWLAALVASDKPAQTGTVSRPKRRPRMGAGHGSAPKVRGYSSYCTDRPGCRCFDCQD